MGVTGLWKLIEPCGKPVPVETLEGKVLAVDISIWLHQVVKGFQDNKGSALNNAHLLGLFHRLCKLLYYRVRPVFIFDGCVPQLKRDTIARRQQQRNKLSNEADRIQALLLQSLAKEKVVQQALGANAEQLLKSPAKRGVAGKSSKNDEDDLFKLPELPAATSSAQGNEDDSELSFSQDDFNSSTSDSSFDESKARYAYNASLQAIDVRSQHFLNLPADVRHEILTDIKETRKQSSWGRLHELPAHSDDFCSFQMKRLLKRRAVQESLENAVQEMGGHTLTYAELCDFFNEEGIATPTAIEKSTRQISSDEHTRFLLVRDLKKKAMASAKQEPELKCETIQELDEEGPSPKQQSESKRESLIDEQPCTSAQAKKPLAMSEAEQKALGAEYDADLALALALSLEESKVYDEKDYEYDSDQDLKLNREQSKQLRHAAKGPARAYMIEYGGMNEDEVENIMEATQLNDTQSLERLLNITVAEEAATKQEPTTAAKAEAKVEQVYTIDTDTDSDLEEVLDERPTTSKNAVNVKKNGCIQIHVNINEQLKPSDDIFADIFESAPKDAKVLHDGDEQTDTDDDFVEVESKSIEEKVKSQAVDIKELKESEKQQNIHEFESSQENQAKTDDKADVIDITESEELQLLDKCDEAASKPLTNINESQQSLVANDAKLSSILADLKKQKLEVENIQLTDPIKSEPALDSILDELKRQTVQVKNLKFDEIKLSDSAVIELGSDDEAKDTKIATIELCDSDDNQPKQNKTPSKNKSINDYFETQYVIKRTPDKATKNAKTPPTTPKVQKPFYVRRTPKSERKRAAVEHSDEAVSPAKKSSKAAKTLFEEQNPTKPVDAEELIKEAADTLKSQKTAEELQTMASSLAQERRDLEIERNRQDRMGMSISQRMSVDCQELLRLFGIPYIVAPMEAEAQCAFLNAVELTNGTITDDSDIWLFGGRTVYKNFFAQNKHVLEFRADQIEQTFNCNRHKLIQLACLVGSDYTTGIHGIGAVTALEILASFGATTGAMDDAMPAVLSTLQRFRDWWQAHKHNNLPPGSTARLSLRKKLKNIELQEGFPSSAVVEAYLMPTVDENRAAFSWGLPDVESIREFARKTFGWTASKTDDTLMPVMKKINDKKLQNSIRNYFQAKSALRVQQPKVSKRVQTAIDRMAGKIDAETPEKPKRAKRSKATAATKADQDEKQPARPKRGKRKADPAATTEAAATEAPTTSAAATSKAAKCARIPNTKEVIPQRQRDLEQMRQNKEKAAQIFKKT